jgi:voltage-gated potassium channel Kch
MMGIIIIAVAAAFLESVPSIYSVLKSEFFWIEVTSIVVFTVEYLLRLYAAPEQEPHRTRGGVMLAFMKKPGSIIDLLAILPYYLSFLISIDLRFLRILRILRVLKLTRYNTAFTTFAMVLNREKRAFYAAMFVTVLITILSGAIVYEVENPVQPDKFDTMPRAMYWAVITLASVGYGDISPVTPIGQAFTMVLAILGIGIVALPAGILGSAFTDQLHQQREQMLSAVEEAFADGVLTEDEERQLESERVRLHLSSEQFEKIKQRALLRHSKEFSTAYVVIKASEEVAKVREILQRLPVDAAVVEIDKLNLPDGEKAALRVLLK